MHFFEYKADSNIQEDLEMQTRRSLLKFSLATCLAVAMGNRTLRAGEPPTLTDDGLWHQSWFLESFLDLKEDLDAATSENKRFAIFWELKGCPYCKETHFVNFARPDISEFVQSNFAVLQLNIIGSRIVTDFDGEELPEKELARKYGVRFTPTILFFPPESNGLAERPVKDREVARAPGYLKPDHFLKIFQFVESRSYERMKFRQYLKTGI